MHHKEFIDRLDDDQIVEAIAEAERATSGEIRVCVSHRARRDALAAACRRFKKLGLHRIAHRNAVLIYFVPRARQFAIFGDTAAHEKCGDAGWQAIVARITPLLKEEKYTEAVVTAVREVGAALARHFPRSLGDTNQHPNTVARD